MINVIIVDDETPARNELKRFLEAEKDFKVVREFSSGEGMSDEINRLNPDVVFLDIHMPKKSGLEIGSELSSLENPPLVVFVTAYDEYAIQAFEVNAIDYLLKPYEDERFKKTCQKIRRFLTDRSSAKPKLLSLGAYLEKRPLKILGHRRNSKERIFIHEQEVLFFHVKLTEVTAGMMNGDELLVNSNLRALLQILEPEKFQQIHRAYIVNLDKVAKVVPLFAGNFNVVLKNPANTTIPLSRRYAKKLKQYLKW